MIRLSGAASKIDGLATRGHPDFSLPEFTRENAVEDRPKLLDGRRRQRAHPIQLAESQKRMQHLESAIRHLDARREGLARQSHTLRQEEIIEEIEVILLNVDEPDAMHHARGLSAKRGPTA